MRKMPSSFKPLASMCVISCTPIIAIYTTKLANIFKLQSLSIPHKEEQLFTARTGAWQKPTLHSVGKSPAHSRHFTQMVHR